MKRILFFIALVCLPVFLIAQEQQKSKLAAQYYRSGEYEKAAAMYEQLYNESKNTDYYFGKYIDCMLSLDKFEESEHVIKKRIKKYPKNIQLLVTYGNVLERQYKEEEAKAQFETAIKRVGANRTEISRLASAFTTLTKYEYAIQTYEKGARLLKDDAIFAYNLGDLYRRKGDIPKMIETYILSLKKNPNYLNNLKSQFERTLTKEHYPELQAQLYAAIQETEDNVPFVELLSWVFIQQRDYTNALRQSKALDRRLSENGNRIFKLGKIASNHKQYDSAIDAYNYIITEKGNTSSFYIDAKKESLACQRKKIVEDYDYTIEDLRVLEKDYETFLNEFGRNNTTASIIMELADLQAFYINDIDKAITLLDDLITYPGINKTLTAKAKISLANFYLMQGERWEATLLYSQVDKALKDDLLGHEARFRNAKLSYYMGDFEWAQAQFEVLKASTSKLIANDALDLSIFIMDNLGLDTTATSLELYAKADLFVFQNRFKDAFTTLDDLLQQFPEHSLQDDVLFLKAQIHEKKRNYTEAATLYQQIMDNYPEEIRADNSLYALARLYENQLNDTEKAKELYQKLFIDFSGSTFAVDARKRFRALRGDDVQ